MPLDTIVAWSGSGTAGRWDSHPVRYAAVAAIGGRLIIAGGTSGDVATREVYSFDPADGQVHRSDVLPHPVTHAAAAVLGDRVYVIGGRGAVQGTQTSADPGHRPRERTRSAGRPAADGPFRRGRGDRSAVRSWSPVAGSPPGSSAATCTS